MGCDCPESGSVPNGCNYIIYSVGHIQNVYRLVEHAIPANAKLRHGRPIVHPDGSLEFRGDPPALSGYRREGSRLYPTWPPCTQRLLSVQVIEQSLSIKGVCGCPMEEHLGLEITVDECQACLKSR